MQPCGRTTRCGFNIAELWRHGERLHEGADTHSVLTDPSPAYQRNSTASADATHAHHISIGRRSGHMRQSGAAKCRHCADKFQSSGRPVPSLAMQPPHRRTKTVANHCHPRSIDSPALQNVLEVERASRGGSAAEVRVVKRRAIRAGRLRDNNVGEGGPGARGLTLSASECG